MRKLTARYPTDLEPWRKLRELKRKPGATKTIAALFRDDPARHERFSITDGDLLFDFSRNRIAPRTMQLLMAWRVSGQGF